MNQTSLKLILPPKAGDDVKVIGPPDSDLIGKTGKVQSVATMAYTYPDIFRPRKRRRPAHGKLDPQSAVATVLIDGSDRPRNFPASALEVI